MTNWKYTDATNTVVWRELEDGRQDSCLASVLPEGTEVLPADPPPPAPPEANPVDKLKAFLAANPDVAEILK